MCSGLFRSSRFLIPIFAIFSRDIRILGKNTLPTPNPPLLQPTFGGFLNLHTTKWKSDEWCRKQLSVLLGCNICSLLETKTKKMSLFGGGSSFSFGSSATPAANANKDIEVASAPTDTISCLRFSPSANFLIASSWDNSIRCWEIQANGTSVPKAEQKHTKPILSCCWHAVST